MAGRITISAGTVPVVLTGLDASNATPAYSDTALATRVHLPVTIPAGTAKILYTADSASITPTVTDTAGNSLSAVAVPCKASQPVALGPFAQQTAGGISVANDATVPGINAGGGVLFCQGGALKWRGSSGTTTTLAPA